MSAEAATWLGEHFRSTLADVRAAVDRFFVAGVNHIVYHGTAYSPDSGAVARMAVLRRRGVQSRNAWWDDFGALNQYVARAQSFLQAAVPITTSCCISRSTTHWPTRGNALLAHFGGANDRPPRKGFEEAAAALQSRGFTYDYISDRQLRSARVANGRLVTTGAVLQNACRAIQPIHPAWAVEHGLKSARRVLMPS